VETVEKNPAEKAAKTKQNAKSKLAINTWALTLKIKIPTSSQATWTEELAVESKTLEMTPPPPSITSRRRRTRWLQGPISRSSTIGSRTLMTTTILNTCTIIAIENKHARSKKVSV
jgi:hypothetical protein